MESSMVLVDSLVTQAPLLWKLRNFPHLAKAWRIPLALALKVPTFYGTLRIQHNKADGRVIDYGLVSMNKVTTAFCEYIAAQLITETSAFGDFKFHDSGIGTTDPEVTDTIMETTDGEARVAGTQVQGASAVAYKTVGTIAYPNSGAGLAITEHGVFNVITAATPTLIDRHEFAAINVVPGDSVTYTYEITFVAGG